MYCVTGARKSFLFFAKKLAKIYLEIRLRTWCTDEENLSFSPSFGVFFTPSTTLLATIIIDSLRGIRGTFSSYI